MIDHRRLKLEKFKTVRYTRRAPSLEVNEFKTSNLKVETLNDYWTMDTLKFDKNVRS